MTSLLLILAMPMSLSCNKPDANLQNLREIRKHIKRQLQERRPEPKLGPAIIRAANRYRIDARLLSSLLFVESEYRVSAVSSTGDYGIAQINEANFLPMQIQKDRLVTDLEYSVDTGARHLAWFLKRYGNTGLCRYNVGTGKLVGQRLENCIKYRNKIKKVYFN